MGCAHRSTTRGAFALMLLLECVPATSRASGPCLAFTEIMNNPAAVPDASGEWFEIANYAPQRIDLGGMMIQDGVGGSFTIVGPLPVDPGGFLVFARSTDPIANGGLPRVDYQFQGIALGNTGGGLVLSLGSVIDAVTYPAGTAGTAWACGVVDHDANDGDTHWYAATTTYGSGDRGTPGIANETMVYGTCSLAGVDAAARVPAFLGRPQPNPSRRGAWVPYRCEARAGATIRVFDGAGRNCRTLALDRGRGTAFWDFADDAGHRVAAGVYWLHAIGFGVDLAPVRVVVLPGN